MRDKLSPVYTIRGFRRRLADIEALPQFAILGAVSGLVTGTIMLLFRFAIEQPLKRLLPGGDYEGFENLPSILHFALPVGGGLILAALFLCIPTVMSRVGVTHVLERLSRHHGDMPLGNALVQFFAATIALLSGQSMGREGPAIHLGAAGSSLFGHYLKLPNNSIRILIGCGVAGSISASFNTPLAGVIFSMEVILMEYTIAGFIPVILAAVTANLMSRLVYADQSAFDMPSISMHSFYDLPWVVLEGLAIGLLASAFIRLIQLVTARAPEAAWIRMLLAGCCTGILALAVPEIMGVGYDTVNDALTGHFGFLMLVGILIVKLLSTAISVGLGVPAGVIGPTIFIGALAGGVFGVTGAFFLPDHTAGNSFYVLLGMGAMMGAVLQAPLSALLAVMELSQNPGIILPSMLAIVVACITSSHLFGHKSIFISLLNLQGTGFHFNPVMVALDRLSVASLMERKVIEVDQHLDRGKLDQLLGQQPVWVLVSISGTPSFAISATDLQDYLDHQNPLLNIDLANIPVRRQKSALIVLQATLAEALAQLTEQRAEAACVIRYQGADSCLGVLTRHDIESNYLL